MKDTLRCKPATQCFFGLIQIIRPEFTSLLPYLGTTLDMVKHFLTATICCMLALAAIASSSHTSNAADSNIGSSCHYIVNTMDASLVNVVSNKTGSNIDFLGSGFHCLSHTGFFVAAETMPFVLGFRQIHQISEMQLSLFKSISNILRPPIHTI